MSNEDQTGEGNQAQDEERVEKLDADDPSLSIDDGFGRLNKKAVKVALAALGSIFAVGFAISMAQASADQQSGEFSEAETELGERNTPGYLELSDSEIRDLDSRRERIAEEDEPSVEAEEDEDIEAEAVLARLDEIRDEPSERDLSRDNDLPSRDGDSDLQQGVSDDSDDDSQEELGGDQSDEEPRVQPRTFNYTGPQSGPNTTAPSSDSGSSTSPEDDPRHAGIGVDVGQSGGGTGSAGGPTEAEAQVAQAEAMEAQAEAQRETDYQAQNMDRQRRDFVSESAREQGGYLDSEYVVPQAPGREIRAGTIIPFTLITGINSDLPGDISAQVIEDVYDSDIGNNVLIPRGSRLIGRYDSAVAFGQSRVLISWDRLIRPDGVSLTLQGMAGQERDGVSGLADQVDYHLGEVLGAVAADSAFQLSTSALVAGLSEVPGFSALASVLEDGSIGDGGEIVVEEYVGRALDRQPTIRIRAGFRGNVFVNRDIVLPVADVSDRSVTGVN